MEHAVSLCPVLIVSDVCVGGMATSGCGTTAAVGLKGWTPSTNCLDTAQTHTSLSLPSSLLYTQTGSRAPIASPVFGHNLCPTLSATAFEHHIQLIC